MGPLRADSVGETPMPGPNRNHGALPAHLPRYEVVMAAAPSSGRQSRYRGP